MLVVILIGGLFSQTVYAGDKEIICHWSDDEMKYVIISVSEKASGAHMMQHENDFIPISTDTCDFDGDGIDDFHDICPRVFNPFQEDLDGDGTGDVCDLSNVITTDTTLATDHSVISDVVVQTGVTLTVPNPHSLTLNSANLISTGTVVVDGGRILVS